MASFAFDVYPADDPAGKISGTGTAARLVRLTVGNQLHDGECLPELYGMGTGFLEIHADHADVQHLQRHGYVKFVRTDGVERDISGFWLERGEFRALSRKEGAGRVLRIEGEGPLFILSRYVLGHAIYATGQTARGDEPNIPHQWSWRSEPLAGMLVRLLEEGTEHPKAFYEAVTWDFTRTVDSNGNAWGSVETYDTKIGTSGLQLYADLQALGLIAWMDADLELHAYRDIDEWRTDRTSLTYAAGKVRFVAGDNIGSDLPKRIWSTQERSDVLIKDRTGDYQTVDEDLNGNPIGSVPWMAYLESRTTADDAAILKMGQLHLTRRSQETDQAKIKHLIGPGGVSGAQGYSPGPTDDYWLGDLITVDSGSSDYDFEDQAIEVAAIRYFLHGGDWVAQAEVGATYLNASQDAFTRAISTTIRQSIQHQDPLSDLIIVIGDGSAVISTGAKPAIPIRGAMTVEGWTALSADGTSGSIEVDLWVGPYADFPASITSADSITASDRIIISSSTKAQDSAPTGWSGAIPANSVLRPNVVSCSGIKILVISLKMRKG